MTQTTRVIGIKFPNVGKLYHYFTDDATVQAGDRVVVDSPQNGLVIVDVRSVDVATSTPIHELKFIVQKIDMDAYQENTRKQEKARELLLRLEQKRTAQSQLEMYAHLASTDEEAKALLDELRSMYN